MGDVIRWWTHVISVQARDMWTALPGPWPVKVLLIVACQLIPGPLDEIALITVAAAWRRRTATRTGTR